MPIRPELREYYGKEWRTVIRPRVLKRAGGQFDGKGQYLGGAKCEQSGKPDRKLVDVKSGAGSMLWRLTIMGWGRWTRDDRKSFSAWIVRGLPWRPRTVQCILTVAHLDHNPRDNQDSNLKALCQWCHLNYDRLHHKETRCEHKDASRPLLQEARAL